MARSLRSSSLFVAIVAIALMVAGPGAATATTASTAAAAGVPRSAGGAPVRVVAGFYPLAWAAARVGGGHVEVENVTPAGAEPHDLELTTRQRDAVEDADLVIVLGGDFQPALEDAAARRDQGTLDVLARLRDQADQRDGPAVDPHVWLDPRLMITVVDEIADALAQVAPAERATFARRASAVTGRLHALDERYRTGLADCRHDTIVTSHEAFGRLAGAYGLREEGVSGISPDTEPDARRLAELADLVRERGITTIFTEDLVSPRIARTLSREAGGVKTVVLSPLETLTDAQRRRGDDYLSVMDENLERLRTALGCR